MRRSIIILTVSNSAIIKSIPKNARVGIFPLHLDPPTVYHQQLFKALVVPLAADDAMAKLLKAGGGGVGAVPATYNPGSTTTSPYGDDWDSAALSRFARRKRLLALLRDYKEHNKGALGTSPPSSSGSSGPLLMSPSSSRSNRNYGNYVNTSKKDAPLRAVIEELISSTDRPAPSDNVDTLSDDEIIAQLKQHVVTSWASSSKGSRQTSYGGLATALRDEIFLDTHSFGVDPSNVERELLELLQEQHYINEEAYHKSSPLSSEDRDEIANSSRTPYTIFSPYDASQALSKQQLQRRKLPVQTAAKIAENSRSSVAGCSLAPFDHLIVIPNSKYPAPIQQSRHLAAMASLSTRGLHPRVHMELYSLEHPEHNDTVMRDLTQYFSNSTIVHWMPNISDVQMWRGYTDMMEKVPMLVLRPRGYHFFNQAGTGGAASPSVGASPLSSSTSLSKAEESGATVSTTAATSSSAAAPLFRFSHRSVPKPSTESEVVHASGDQEGGAEASTNESSREPAATNEDSSSSTNTNSMMARSLKSRLNAQQIEIIEVERLSGAGVRQLLWDRGTRHEEHGVIPPLILRYMDSHGLYRDFRKGFAQSEQSMLHNQSSSGKIATSSFQATVALASLIPRLEIHYDRSNLIAREQYENLKNFECADGQDPDLIVPIGGDGYMMHCIRQNWHRFIPFFGVNAGHRGYLLNEPKRLEELFSFPLKLYHMPMLYCEADVAVLSNNTEGSMSMSKVREKMAAALRPSMAGSPGKGPATSGDGGVATPSTPIVGSGASFLMGSQDKSAKSPDAQPLGTESPIFAQGEAAMGEVVSRAQFEKNVTYETRTELAFNDAWIDRATGQTAWLRVIVNGAQQLKCVRGDGVLVSTAAGSTAYAQALGASPIPADVQLIQLVGSNIVSPSRWRPVHLNQADSVTLEVIDMEKRPCKCFVDSNCLGYARSLKVRTSRVASVQLAFCHSYDLQQKLYQVQFPKEDEW